MYVLGLICPVPLTTVVRSSRTTMVTTSPATTKTPTTISSIFFIIALLTRLLSEVYASRPRVVPSGASQGFFILRTFEACILFDRSRGENERASRPGSPGSARQSQDFESELEAFPKPRLRPHAILPVSALTQKMTSPRH